MILLSGLYEPIGNYLNDGNGDDDDDDDDDDDYF